MRGAAALLFALLSARPQESAPASSPARIEPSALEAPPARDEVLARVERSEIRLSDLGRAMLFHYGAQSRDVLAKLATDALARREASRLGVFVRREDVDRAVEEGMEDLRKRVEAESGGRRTLEAFLREEAGTTPAQYRTSLERFTLARRFLETCIRYGALLEDRAVVRVLTTGRRAEAEELLGLLREGADFAVLARERSIGPARADGGKLPPFSRGWEHPVAALAFTLRPGEVGGPVEEKKGDATLFHLVRLVERLPGRSVAFAQVEEEVREGLRARPIEEFEYALWHGRASARWKVELPAPGGP